MTGTEILRRAVVTERSTQLKETRNQFVFEVTREATKQEIKKAVETAFKVKVVRVNTMQVRGKVKKMGRYEGRRSGWKKAVVTLKQGDNIQLVEGV